MYSPLDLTLLDYHLGNITIWQTAINAIHERGMYVLMDNTMSTYVFSIFAKPRVGVQELTWF